MEAVTKCCYRVAFFTIICMPLTISRSTPGYRSISAYWNGGLTENFEYYSINEIGDKIGGSLASKKSSDIHMIFSYIFGRDDEMLLELAL